MRYAVFSVMLMCGTILLTADTIAYGWVKANGELYFSRFAERFGTFLLVAGMISIGLELLDLFNALKTLLHRLLNVQKPEVASHSGSMDS